MQNVVVLSYNFVYIHTNPYTIILKKKNWVRKFGGEVGGRCANYERHK